MPCPERLEAEVAFDSDLLEWDAQPALPLGLARQTGFDREWGGPTDLSATVRFSAGDDALLLAVEAADNTAVSAAGGDRFRGDQIRLYWAASPEAKPVEARQLVIVPSRRDGTTFEPAAVLDGDRREPVPGAIVTWLAVDGGYRVEARVPWTMLPGGWAKAGDRRGVHLAVLDWDDGGNERSRLSWPTPLRAPAAPQGPAPPPGYQPPRLADPERPAAFGAVDIVARLDADAARGYLAAFMPLGVDRNFYQDDEEVRVTALAGLGPEAAARCELFALDRDGVMHHLARGSDWRDGAVDGVIWTWRTPLTFDQPVLLVATLDEPAADAPRSYAGLESIGSAYREHLDRLEALRERIYQAAIVPEADARLRRRLGAILINIEDREQSHRAWLSYLVREDLNRLTADLTEFARLFEVARSGQDPYAGRKGTYLRGYVSDIDDTVQHYSVAIPDDWAPNGTWPLIINIHGYGFGRFLGHPAPMQGDAVNVACFGRGNGDYKLWCERDILTVLDAMIEDYQVDVNRVYITGGSMGGTGSFHMASLFPDRFAAIGPTCGNANHHVWEEVWGWGQKTPTFLTPFRDWLESTTSSYQYAENFRHIGTYCVHGDRDDIVPVGHGRTMTARLKRLGYDVVYEEQAGVGHSGFGPGTGDRQRRYMMERRRDPDPRHVTFKTSWPRYAGAYWVRLERFRRLAEDAQIDARIVDQTITVETSNVQRFSLRLNGRLLDLNQPVQVTVDGLPAYEGLVPETGVLRLGVSVVRWKPVDPPGGLEKNESIGGPVEHAFMSRFLLVCGTSGDRRTNEVNRRMTEQMAEKWRRWGREQRARVKMDYELTEQDLADSNLICYGGPDSNRFVARVNSLLPIRLEPNAVVFGRERFEGEDLGVKFCYPNPLNPRRYVCIFAGVTWKGTYDINGRFGNWFDWGVFDDRNGFDFTVFDARTQQAPETFVRAGYFDWDWSLDDAYIITGGEAERAATVPREPPDPLARVPDRDEVWLSELTPTSVVMEKGVLAFDHSFGGYPITLGGQVFERGLGVHPQAEVTYQIEGRFQTFEAWCGVDLEGATSVSAAREDAERVAFQVYGDGKLLADSGEMRWNSRPRHLVLNVAGVRELRLVARALDGRKWLYGNSSWGECRLSRAAEALPDRRVVRGVAEQISLDGEWWLDEYAVGEGVAREAHRLTEPPGDRPVRVPGSIPMALVAAGRLPDPYRDANLAAVDATATREWWLYRRFDLPASWAERILRLSLHGVCQVGDVWLNGRYVGTIGGPFERRELDVAAAARPGGANLLAVRILAGPAPWTGVTGFRVPDRDEIVGLDVAYGADAGGRALPLGLLGGATVRAAGPAVLGPPTARIAVTGGLGAGAEAATPGTLTVRASVSNPTDAPLEVALEATARPFDGDETVARGITSVTVPPGETVAATVTAEVAEARAWWPAGAGAQPLYQVDLTAAVGDRTADARSTVGAVVTGRLHVVDGRLVATIHDVEVPLRLATLPPLDRFLRASPERLETVLRLALDAGLNAVRVRADAGLEPGLLDLCDRLGLLVIQDLPLSGNVGRAPESDVRAAVEGLVLAARSHPCLVGWCLGRDVPAEASAERRLAIAEGVLAELDPDRAYLQPTDGAATSWGLITRLSEVEQRLDEVAVQVVRAPTAPPADLGFLDRAKLPEAEAAAPWPLTGWWGFRGGSAADLAAAAAWLAPAAGEAGMMANLRAQQAESVRRQLAEGLAAGRTICLDGLTESWPRVGGALIDWAGTPRPAFGVAQRLLTTPAVFAQAAEYRATVGQLIGFDLHVRRRGDRPWLPPAAGTELRARVVGLDGRVAAEQLIPLHDQPDGPVGSLIWEVEPTTRPGGYLLVTELVGGDAAPEVVPLAVAEAIAAPPVRAIWLDTTEPPARLAALVPRDQLTQFATAVDLIYLGGEVTPAEADAVAARVAAGAGLVLVGPPPSIAGTAIEALLAARPTLSPENALGPAVVPTASATGHPVAGALGGLPAGRPDALYRLADGAQVLARFGDDRPLLVESAWGQGRVLLLLPPESYGRALRAWPGWGRLTAALAAYAAKLPHHLAARLVDPPPGADLADLADLPAAPLRVDLPTSPLLALVGEPGVRDVTLRNEGGTAMLAVDLRLVGLPDGVTATVSPTGFALLPGASRTVRLTVRSYRRGRRDATLALLADGWGVRPARVEFPLQTGE